MFIPTCGSKILQTDSKSTTFGNFSRKMKSETCKTIPFLKLRIECDLLKVVSYRFENFPQSEKLTSFDLDLYKIKTFKVIFLTFSLISLMYRIKFQWFGKVPVEISVLRVLP